MHELLDAEARARKAVETGNYALNEATGLVQRDFAKAFEKAKAISGPLYRCQALSEVAKNAPTAMVDQVLRQAVKAAHAAGDEAQDGYRYVSVSGCVLAAMVQRNRLDWLGRELHSVFIAADEIKHILNRSCALMSVLNAVWTLDSGYRGQLMNRLVECEAAGTSWKCALNLGWAAIRLAGEDPNEAARLGRAYTSGAPSVRLRNGTDVQNSETETQQASRTASGGLPKEARRGRRR